MLIHHVGYFVTDIEEASKDFEQLGYISSSTSMFDIDRNIFIKFLHSKHKSGGGGQVELVAPAENCNLFPGRMRQLGSMPYHICYECDDFNEDIKRLQQSGFLLIRKPQPAIAIDNRRVAFLYSSSIGQIELLE